MATKTVDWQAMTSMERREYAQWVSWEVLIKLGSPHFSFQAYIWWKARIASLAVEQAKARYVRAAQSLRDDAQRIIDEMEDGLVGMPPFADVLQRRFEDITQAKNHEHAVWALLAGYVEAHMEGGWPVPNSVYPTP
jgi:hypothetical protein